MLTIHFHDRQWLFTGAALADGGAITTPDAYRAGTASHAHLMPDGRVMRWRTQIGSVTDIAIVGPAECEVDDPVAAMLTMLTDDSWWRHLS